MKRAFHDSRQIFGATDTINPFAKWTAQFKLIAIQVQIYFLMGMPAMVVRLNIAGDCDQRNRVQCRIGKAGYGVCQTRPNVQQDDSWLSGSSRIAIRGVRRQLLVTGGDVANSTSAQGIEDLNHGMAAQSKNYFDANLLQVFHQLLRGDLSTGAG